MDPATTDSLNTAVKFQGAMLGRHEQELSAARHAVETLAVQVSDLSGQFQSLRLVPPATSWSSESPEPRVNNPPCYSGQPTECRSFLTQCDIVFSLQPNTYSRERARIAYVISLLTGRAREWGTAIWEARAECSNVYQNFKEEMIRVFDRSVFGKEASRALASLCQGDRSITDYSIEFRTLAASSDWNEPALLARFLEGLHAEVKDEILSREVPSSVDSLIALAIRIERRVDLRYRARGRELALTGFPFSASQPSPSIGSETEPMQLGGIHISTKERERRITNRLCFYCGSAGHFVMSCPVKGQSSSVSGGLLVSATTQVSPSRSCTTLSVHLRWTGSAASCSALIDSGAEGCFMDEAWARKHDIPLRELGRLTPMFALDGSPLPSIRCETLPLTLTVSGNHSETISFLIFCSPVTPVVLGHPWLEEPGDVTGVPEEYHDLRTVFSRSRASSLPPHRSYDCCIDLLPGTTSPRGRLFSLSAPERKALEDYLSAEGIQMDPAKVQDVSDWPVPKSRVELQRFLGFANFFRRFIRNFGQVAAPLTVLTSVKSCFKWSGSAQGAFDFLKKRFTSAPILVTPDVTKQFIVEVDVSEVGVGAILSQRFQSDDKVHPCAYFSHRLSPSERNYDVGNRELLAIRLALGEWRQWLEGATVPFVVWTDHKNLGYIRSAKRLNARQARWALFFARFEFVISYRPGNKNTKPDALSRLFSSPVASTDPEGILPEGRVVGLTVWGIERQVKQALTHTASPRACPSNLLFVPVSTRLAVLQWAHSAKLAGHPGVRGTLASIRQRFWWPTQERDTRRFVAACSDCAQTKSGNSPPAGRLRPLPIPSRPWSHIALDFITGLPSSAGRTVRAANKRRIKSPRYCRGQRVWLSTRNLPLTTASRRLTPRFIGPFRVSQVVKPVAVRLLLPRHLRRVHPVFHVSCVKPFLRAPIRNTPLHGRLYSLSGPETKAMEEYIEESLATGGVCPSASPACAGFFFVEKNKTLRLCIDYRGLNDITIKNRYPLPLLSSAFEPLQGANIFSKLDLRNAYHLVWIREGDECKTAFNTASGHYEYQVMLFGVTNCLPGSAVDRAFVDLKHCFTTSPILVHPDPSHQFVVEVDASDVGVGAILCQRSSQDQKLHPCAFLSHRLNPAERSYDVGNRELLAVKMALEEWRHWKEQNSHSWSASVGSGIETLVRKAQRSQPGPEGGPANRLFLQADLSG
ncbi:uncharacterized protein ACWYII_021537 [Salvelinus alpinus]